MLKADELAQEQALNANENYLVVGQVIELKPHPYIRTLAQIYDIGWDPEQIKLKQKGDFNVEDILTQCSGLKEFDLPNGDKFCLYDTNYVTNDNPDLTYLELKHTDYFTLMSIKENIQNSYDIRKKFGNLEPLENRIPHSLCLHYIVRYDDGNILCIKRDSKMEYFKNSWSFSGEEQLSKEDIEYGDLLALFKRALCEEVYPLRGKLPEKARFEEKQKFDNYKWSHIKEDVNSMLLWSIFLEERIYNFSLLGVIQLNISIRDFKDKYIKLIGTADGNRDNEGKLYYATKKEYEKLLSNGKCNVTGVFNNSSVEIKDDELHPTSRYRLFRIYNAKK
jgi:hypothetical protein